MNEVLGFGKNIIGTSVFLAFQWNPALLAAAGIAALAVCFFGLKLVRVLSLIVGFAAGAAAGLAISSVARTDGVVTAIIVLAGAVVLAALSFFIYRFGVFCTAFMGSVGAALALQGGGLKDVVPFSGTVFLVLLAVCVVIGILAAIFVEPLVIVVTACSGGVLAGFSIAGLLRLESVVWAEYAIEALLVVIGLVLQFAMHRKRSGKKEHEHPAETEKGKSTVESEVEKARAILDDDDE